MAIMVIKASSAGLGDGNVLQLITDVEFSFHSFVVEIIDVSMILLSRDDSSKLEGWFKGSKMQGLARRLVILLLQRYVATMRFIRKLQIHIFFHLFTLCKVNRNFGLKGLLKNTLTNIMVCRSNICSALQIEVED